MSVTTKRRRSTVSDDHRWPLGALAELVATASAASTELHINASAQPPTISLLDNGPGHPSATLSALTTPSPWRDAALRVGSRLTLLTRLQDGTSTAAVLSNPPQILNWASMSPQHPDLQRFLQHTPWDSYEQVDTAFTSIRKSGSLLVITGLQPSSTDRNAYELDFSDPHDIRCPSRSSIRLKSSLRVYLQLLFLRPKARLFIRGRIVRERRLSATMWGRTDFLYSPRVAQDSVATIRFGFDPHASSEEYGMLIYCKGRLIHPYLRVGIQTHQDSDVRVVGIVEADFLTPRKNNQAFERGKLHQGLMFAIDRSLKVFWNQYGSMEKVLQRHSQERVRRWCRCDACGHWRVIVSADLSPNPEDISCLRWTCEMNTGGTVKCGQADDEDEAVCVGNRRIFGAGKFRQDLSGAYKKTSTSPITIGSKVESHQTPQHIVRKRPRSSKEPSPGWEMHAVSQTTDRSSPMPNATIPGLKPREDHATGNPEQLLREPNLDLDQPTPELVSPELHFHGDGFSLAKNDVAAITPDVRERTASIGIPQISAVFGPSSETSPETFGPVEAILQDAGQNDESMQGNVPGLGTNIKSMQTACTNKPANEDVQDVNKAPSPTSCDERLDAEKMPPISAAETLKSSSTISHENDRLRDESIHGNESDLTTRNSDHSKRIQESNIGEEEASKTKTYASQQTSKPLSDVNTLEQSRPDLSLKSIALDKLDVHDEPNTKANSGTPNVDLISEALVKTPSGDTELGRRDISSRMTNSCVATDAMKCAKGPGICEKQSDWQHISTTQNQTNAHVTVLDSRRPKGSIPTLGSSELGNELKASTQTAKRSVGHGIDSRIGNVCGISTKEIDASVLANAVSVPDGHPVLTQVERTIRRDGNEVQGNTLLSLASIRGGEKIRGGADNNYGILSSNPLEGVDMSNLLDFGQDGEFRTSMIPPTTTSDAANVISKPSEVFGLHQNATRQPSITVNPTAIDGGCPMDITGENVQNAAVPESHRQQVLDHTITEVERNPTPPDEVHDSHESPLNNSGKKRGLISQQQNQGPGPTKHNEQQNGYASRTLSNGSQQGSQNAKRRRVGEDGLAMATEVAASAAQRALGDFGTSGPQGSSINLPPSNMPLQMTWSQIALSAAVAAGAAAAAATTTTKHTQAPVHDDRTRRDANEKDKIESEKLRKLISCLLPDAGKSILDDLVEKDAEVVVKEIMERVEFRAKLKAERTLAEDLELCRSKLKSEGSALRKIRNLVRIFLDEVVGILEHGNDEESIEKQMEFYLQLLDALPRKE